MMITSQSRSDWDQNDISAPRHLVIVQVPFSVDVRQERFLQNAPLRSEFKDLTGYALISSSSQPALIVSPKPFLPHQSLLPWAPERLQNPEPQ
jgi:hypothetical protein